MPRSLSELGRVAPMSDISIPPPATRQLALAIEARELVTGWERIVSSPADVAVWKIAAEACPVRAISVGIADPDVRTRSFRFAAPPSVAPSGRSGSPCLTGVVPEPSGTGCLTYGKPPPTTCRPDHTRIRPPDDVVKLEDRLRYLLQPSLESLLDSRSLEFPCGRFRIRWKGSPSSIRAMRRSWPTRWGWARRCRPSPRSASCCTAARFRACSSSAPSRWCRTGSTSSPAGRRKSPSW